MTLDSYSRRNFLKLGAALLAGGAAISNCSAAQAMGFLPGQNLQGAQGLLQSAKGYCPFCQVRCTYQAQIRGGRVESLVGEANNRWTGGAMCPKGMSIVELINSPFRLTEPMVRQEGGGWKRISYQEAVELTAAKVRENMERNGESAGDRMAMTMPLWDCRESELAAVMTLHMAGCVHTMPPGETCISSASNMLALMTGVFFRQESRFAKIWAHLSC